MGIVAPLRVVPLVPLLLAFGVVVVPPSWTSQEASIWRHDQGAPWPQAGSRVEYELGSSFTTPDGSYQQETVARLSLVYDGTAWTGSCSWRRTEAIDGVATSAEGSSPSGGKPASAPSDARRGETVVVTLLDDPAIAEDCRQRGETVQVVRRDGGKIVGEEMPDTSAYQDVSIAWDREAGLVLEWSRLTHGGSSTGRLVEMDAPAS